MVLFSHTNNSLFEYTNAVIEHKKEGKVKRIFVLLIAILMAMTLVGCNVAPNVPRVTPYVTGGNYNYNTTNRTPILKNPTDKDMIPYTRAR